MANSCHNSNEGTSIHLVKRCTLYSRVIWAHFWKWYIHVRMFARNTENWEFASFVYFPLHLSFWEFFPLCSWKQNQVISSAHDPWRYENIYGTRNTQLITSNLWGGNRTEPCRRHYLIGTNLCNTCCIGHRSMYLHAQIKRHKNANVMARGCYVSCGAVHHNFMSALQTSATGSNCWSSDRGKWENGNFLWSQSGMSFWGSFDEHRFMFVNYGQTTWPT